ncbi:hypothetical protein ACT3SP_12480 [Brachybacterium sp. AOP43-C2-M15]|uniref:hypothetical protein n=1 Tax=Brachybacterium sp. AOP43-C2-M15 TaxID=3457661 RepID=UPI00403470D6
MDMKVPEDCGNSPRMAIVAEFAAAWAAEDDTAVREHLHEDLRWVLVGQTRADGPTDGADGAGPVPPPFSAERGEILTVLNHGRLAACDGYLMRGDERVDFCHVLRFAGTTKSARIREVRTYLQPSTAEG